MQFRCCSMKISFFILAGQIGSRRGADMTSRHFTIWVQSEVT
jgi:hypothetical protein